MPEKRSQVGRLAYREEGAMWNCYFAETGTMKDAIHLGAIRMTLAKDPAFKAAFMDMMRQALDVAFSTTLGVTPEWRGPQTAPEHERSGKA